MLQDASQDELGGHDLMGACSVSHSRGTTVSADRLFESANPGPVIGRVLCPGISIKEDVRGDERRSMTYHDVRDMLAHMLRLP